VHLLEGLSLVIIFAAAAAAQMATFDGAEALLEELRKNAYEPAKVG
jgi:hypothetical protein